MLSLPKMHKTLHMSLLLAKEQEALPCYFKNEPIQIRLMALICKLAVSTTCKLRPCKLRAASIYFPSQPFQSYCRFLFQSLSPSYLNRFASQIEIPQAVLIIINSLFLLFLAGGITSIHVYHKRPR